MIGRVSNTSPAAAQTENNLNIQQTPGGFEAMLAALLEQAVAGSSKMGMITPDSLNVPESTDVYTQAAPAKGQGGVSGPQVQSMLEKAARFISMDISSELPAILLTGQVAEDDPANTGPELTDGDKTQKNKAEEEVPDLLGVLPSIPLMGTYYGSGSSLDKPVENPDVDTAPLQDVKKAETPYSMESFAPPVSESVQINVRSGVGELDKKISQYTGAIEILPFDEKTGGAQQGEKILSETGFESTEVKVSKEIASKVYPDMQESIVHTSEENMEIQTDTIPVNQESSGTKPGTVPLESQQQKPQTNNRFLDNMLHEISKNVNVEITQNNSPGIENFGYVTKRKISSLTGDEENKSSKKTPQTAVQTGKIPGKQVEDAAAAKPVQESIKGKESAPGPSDVYRPVKGDAAGNTDKTEIRPGNYGPGSNDSQYDTPFGMENNKNQIHGTSVPEGEKQKHEGSDDVPGRASNQYTGGVLSRSPIKIKNDIKFGEKISGDIEGPSVNRMEVYRSQGEASARTENVTGGSEVIKQAAVPERESVLSQVYDRIKTSNIRDVHELHVNLKPAELGDVVIKLVMDKGMVTGRIMVENNHVKSLVESGLSGIKESLRDQSINLSDISISVGTGNAGSNYNHGQGQGNGRWVHTNNSYLRAGSINTVNDMNNTSRENGASGMLNILA